MAMAWPKAKSARSTADYPGPPRASQFRSPWENRPAFLDPSSDTTEPPVVAALGQQRIGRGSPASASAAQCRVLAKVGRALRLRHHEVRHITAGDGTQLHSFHEVVQYAITTCHLTVG